MEFEPTAIPDVVVIRPRLSGDGRGHFFESWQEREFAVAGLEGLRDTFAWYVDNGHGGNEVESTLNNKLTRACLCEAGSIIACRLAIVTTAATTAGSLRPPLYPTQGV